jgi:hypothetical protein
MLVQIWFAGGSDMHAAASEPIPADWDAEFAHAQYTFYSARYDEASNRALALHQADPESLAALDLRASALLFQLKQVLDPRTDKEQALRDCAPCSAWLASFLEVTAQGRTLARARLAVSPDDETARFFLGKLGLNYVWLQLGPMGRRTGWGEYWEARRSFDAILASNPRHVRARVSRAWIDYIVATKLPRGTRWLLGGGNRKRALLALREAAGADAEKYAHTEAQFSLWDMLVRERQWREALTVAQGLARDFPENLRLIEFVATHNARLEP